MTRIESVLQEIKLLDDNELDVVLREINDRKRRVAKMKAILKKYRGIGQGVWPEDAQEFISKSREDREIRR